MKKNRGFTLIEVLVAVFILAIGLLGIAGLQLTASQANADAVRRAQAIVLVKDMVSRIEANKTTAMASASEYGTSALTGSGYVGNDTGLGASSDGLSGTCSGVIADRRTWDFCQWRSALQRADVSASAGYLPSARGCVAHVSTYVFDVTVAWQTSMKSTAPSATCGQSSITTNYRRAVTIRVQLANLSGA